MPTQKSLKASLKRQKKRLVHGYELAQRKRKTTRPKTKRRKK